MNKLKLFKLLSQINNKIDQHEDILKGNTETAMDNLRKARNAYNRGEISDSEYYAILEQFIDAAEAYNYYC